MEKTILYATHHTPKVEGPIPVTETSHPFSSMAYAKEPLDLAAYGYSEEEYFISGEANVYEGKETLKIKDVRQPYKTRIMVRKPAPEKFSGRVYLDIYNASNGYDIEDVWRRSYQYYMENGHIYIGMTAKPINMVSLKHFDYERYQSLNWSGDQTVPLPEPDEVSPIKSIKGTEEGLVWDMLSQLGYMVKTNQAPFLEGYNVEELYMTGQSQSGIYMNTYAYFFHPYVEDIFDGFLTVVGSGVMRDLRQGERLISLIGARDQLIADSNIPHILVSAHGDINLFKADTDILRDLASDERKIRLYEVASSPHTDPTSPVIPHPSEVAKTGNGPRLLDGEVDFEVNSIQLSYYVNTALEFLHEWAIEGIEPPPSAMLERGEDDKPLEDVHGNGVGGVRNPYVDVPIAKYLPNEPTKLQKIGLDVGVNGAMEYFEKDKLQDLYKDKADYLDQFKKAVAKQVEEGWLLTADAKRMVHWSEDVADHLFD